MDGLEPQDALEALNEKTLANFGVCVVSQDKDFDADVESATEQEVEGNSRWASPVGHAAGSADDRAVGWASPMGHAAPLFPSPQAPVKYDKGKGMGKPLVNDAWANFAPGRRSGPRVPAGSAAASAEEPSGRGKGQLGAKVPPHGVKGGGPKASWAQKARPRAMEAKGKDPQYSRRGNMEGWRRRNGTSRLSCRRTSLNVKVLLWSRGNFCWTMQRA